jgi:hypothetical protein
VTRTTGAESSARWTRNDTHVTYVRDGNLFIVPVQGGSLSVTQLTDVTLKKADPRLTESQRFIREEEEKLIGYLRQQMGAGRLPGREPCVHGGDQLGGWIPPYLEAVRG